MEVVVGLLIGSGLLVAMGAAVLFVAWMLFDCLAYEPRGGLERLLWAAAILAGLPPFGGFLYFVMRRPQRQIEMGE